jgi:hypothetical protein
MTRKRFPQRRLIFGADEMGKIPPFRRFICLSGLFRPLVEPDFCFILCDDES